VGTAGGGADRAATTPAAATFATRATPTATEAILERADI
jgi:hypothetical protein